jgi:hypothetical protein
MLVNTAVVHLPRLLSMFLCVFLVSYESGWQVAWNKSFVKAMCMSSSARRGPRAVHFGSLAVSRPILEKVAFSELPLSRRRLE